VTSPALDHDVSHATSRGLHVALWICQVLLFAMFLFAGGMKLLHPELGVQQGHLPWALVIFIGVSEIAGSLGVVLPGLTRVRPGLIPLAALGLAVIMVLATILHLVRAETSHAVAPIVLLAMALFVAWGRSRKAPIRPRAA
jgi:hypothetical protein